MARRRKNSGIAELVLMGANPATRRKPNPRRVEHDARWAIARQILAGKNPSLRIVQRDGEWVLMQGHLSISTHATRADAQAAKRQIEHRERPAPRPRKYRSENPPSGEKAIKRAAGLYEEFHGKAASEVIEMQEADTVRKTYTALGDLVDLTIETPDGKAACIQFAGDGVKVASAPGGKQLYLIGGMQSLDDQIEKFGADASKDFVELGRAMQITYRARKSINDFRLVDYYHDLGEESGRPPFAFYDRIRQRIYLVGGTYHVEAPGIID